MPALLSTEPAGDTSSVSVFPNDAVGIIVGLAIFGASDVEQKVIALAEAAVARAIEAGLPVPPTPIPSAPAPSTGVGLCSILSPEEASAALGGASIGESASDIDGCAYLAEEGAVFLEIHGGDRAASFHEGMSGMEERFELAGMPAGQIPMPPGSAVVILPDDATAVMLTLAPPEGIDAHAAARALAELLAPRIRTYLGM
jgi:hypothetical protein